MTLLSRDDEASVDEIAHAAGVSRTTFYRAFPSRAALLAQLKLEPEPDARQRLLETAAALLQRQTLTRLSMDELAAGAGVSRASVYRLFPGKAALFRELLVVFSPFEPIMRLLDEQGDRLPEELIPVIVVTAYRAVAPHAGIARTLIVEVTSLSEETRQAFAQTGMQAIARLGSYVQTHMDAGRLRRMPPLLALQALIGPVMMLVLSTPVLHDAGVPPTDAEPAVRQLAQLWLKGMSPL
jgi:AcrR family transcriptional regulator